jgi:hypothetical protein
MVFSMINKDHNERETAGFGNDSEGSESDPVCGFSTPEDLEADDIETSLVSEKPERSQHEEKIIREALGFGSDSESKWCDARGQSGPAPADFGDHKPIPIDAVCASVVLSEGTSRWNNEEGLDLMPDLFEEEK